MKAISIFKGFGLLYVLTLGLISCSDGSSEDSRSYTPLYTYFNPIKLDMNMETLMPYFVNYPTDWAKMGLKGHPMTVTYEYNSESWGVTAISQYGFRVDGRLSEHSKTSFNYGSSGFDVVKFEYDGNSNLVGISSQKNGNQDTDDGFAYDASNRLIRRDKNGRRHYNVVTFLYEYHNNGALKSIVPEKDNITVNESGIVLGEMRFDSLSRMVNFETPSTSNIFLKDVDVDNRGKSSTTYTYKENLCTQAVEKIPIEFSHGTETLTCTSTFAYNSHGDLAEWTYSGGVYKENGNSWRVDDMVFTIKFDYEYDDEGNWTQAKIIFPENIDEIPALRIYYLANTRGYSSVDKSPSVADGEIPFLTVSRNIEYWNENLVNAVSKGNVEIEPNEKGLRYKGTDTYGLLGAVKSVITEHECKEFDQSGNLVYEKNSFGEETTYRYVSPTTYNISNCKDALMNIEIQDGMRSDADSGINTELNQQYKFDSRKRLVEHVFCSHMAIVTCKYQYKGDDKYPSVMIEEHPEDGITTYKYEYIKFDKKDNWIERNVSYVTEYDEYDEDFNYVGKKKTEPYKYKEIREIEYW